MTLLSQAYTSRLRSHITSPSTITVNRFSLISQHAISRNLINQTRITRTPTITITPSTTILPQSAQIIRPRTTAKNTTSRRVSLNRINTHTRFSTPSRRRTNIPNTRITTQRTNRQLNNINITIHNRHHTRTTKGTPNKLSRSDPSKTYKAHTTPHYHKHTNSKTTVFSTQGKKKTVVSETERKHTQTTLLKTYMLTTTAATTGSNPTATTSH